jgi:hypothetical protein
MESNALVNMLNQEGIILPGIQTEVEGLRVESSELQTGKIISYLILDNSLENEVYHSSTEKEFAGVPYNKITSSSVIKEALTPTHLYNYMNRAKIGASHFTLGTAFHTMLGEVDKFEYELFDDSNIVAELEAEGSKNARATNKYKEWKAKYCKEDGKTLRENVLSKQEFSAMFSMRKKMRKDPILVNLFKNADPETSIFLEYENDLRIKFRPDALKIADAQDVENFKDHLDIKVGDLINISIKTTLDASPFGFQKQAYNFKYHLSEAMYKDAIENLYKTIGKIGEDNKMHTIFVVAEKGSDDLFKGLYMIRPCGEEFINAGRRAYVPNLITYKETMKSNDFEPGYDHINNKSSICPMNLPSWAAA